MATIDELRSKAAEIDAALSDTKAQAKNGMVIVAAVVLVGVFIAFRAGRRRGVARRAVVEVYRD